MDSSLIQLVIVAVTVPLFVLCVIAWIAVRIINRSAKKNSLPTRPDELEVSSAHELFSTDEDSETNDTVIEEPLNWFERERFHQDLEEFLKQNETPK